MLAPIERWYKRNRAGGLSYGVFLCHPEISMRDAEVIETELMEISAIADESVKFDRIIAWCASHPDEVPFALHHLMNRRGKHRPADSAEAP